MVERLTPIISKHDTNYRKALGPGIEGVYHTPLYGNRGQLKKFVVWVQSGIQHSLFANSKGVCSDS